MLPPMSFKLGPGEQVIFEGHPSWRSILGFYIKGAFITAIVALIIYAFGKLFNDGDTDEALITLVLLVGGAISVVAGFVKRVATRYTITNRRLHVKHGIVSREVQETRLERVQDVSYTQSILQRILQVGDVDFDTAANDPTDFVFAGVADPAGVVDRVHSSTRIGGDSGVG